MRWPSEAFRRVSNRKVILRRTTGPGTGSNPQRATQPTGRWGKPVLHRGSHQFFSPTAQAGCLVAADRDMSCVRISDRNYAAPTLGRPCWRKSHLGPLRRIRLLLGWAVSPGERRWRYRKLRFVLSGALGLSELRGEQWRQTRQLTYRIQIVGVL